MERPTACRATRPSFMVTFATHTSLMTHLLWERHIAVGGNTQRTWKITIRNGSAGSEPNGQSNQKIPLLHSLLLLLRRKWSPLRPPPPPPQSPWSSHDASDGPSPSWDDVSWAPNDETSHPSHDDVHSARNDSTRRIRREGSLLLLVLCYFSTSPGDQGAVTLFFFSNGMTRKTCSPFLSERIVLEGNRGTKKKKKLVSFVLWTVKIDLSILLVKKT